jgi:UDP-2,3-diacylglucosamine hydrolase
MKSTKIGLIAGAGRFPVLLAERMRERGENLVIAGIRGHASAEAFAPHGFQYFYPGEIQAACRWFQQHEATDVVLAGAFQWPKRGRRLKADLSVWPWLPLLMLQGDDRRLRRVARLFERQGVSIVSALPWIPDWFVAGGVVCGPEPTNHVQALVDLGVSRCREFVRYDKGQAVCVSAKGSVSYEDRRGTNALIAGVSDAGGVLVKMKKISQDMRFDVPTIGPETVERAAEAGLNAIVVEAHAVMLLEKLLVLHKCRRANISLVAV